MNRVRIAAVAALLLTAATARAQQVADSSFVPEVPHPAYETTHPRVLFDEGHHNFHTTEGRYRVFADLLRRDGYTVVPNPGAFTGVALRGFDVLVIANALGPDASVSDDHSSPAFTASECDSVLAWVQSGGALLLISDHTPFGEAARALSRRVGVDMSGGFTVDSRHQAAGFGNPTVLLYSRENGLLADHPITTGRDTSERVNTITAFTGQSLVGPPGSVALMKLTDSAIDLPSRASLMLASRGEAHASSARGRSQGVAFRLGRGRVVVLGEAAMLSAQKILTPGQPPILMGMNHPGTDNRQFTLNLMHWLSGLLN
jgi:hypothetical protein